MLLCPRSHSEQVEELGFEPRRPLSAEPLDLCLDCCNLGSAQPKAAKVGRLFKLTQSVTKL